MQENKIIFIFFHTLLSGLKTLKKKKKKKKKEEQE
jgi:hypothetical protein